MNEDLLDSGDPSRGLDRRRHRGASPGRASRARPRRPIDEARASEAEVAAFYANHPGDLRQPRAHPLGRRRPRAAARRPRAARVAVLRARRRLAAGRARARHLGRVHRDRRRARRGRAPGAVRGGGRMGLARARDRVRRRPSLRRRGRSCGCSAAFGDFFNRMFSTFSNADFAALMGVQFLVDGGRRARPRLDRQVDRVRRAGGLRHHDGALRRLPPQGRAGALRPVHVPLAVHRRRDRPVRAPARAGGLERPDRGRRPRSSRSRS